jgi:hypothetical protein
VPNELNIGTRRTGNLVDFDPDTPAVNVTLERSEQGISLEVPWSAIDSPYASWFLHEEIQMGSDEKRDVPKVLSFSDSHGSVLLVDCWPQGFHTNLVTGTGRVWARYAVMGVSDEIDFRLVNGLRTQVSGLREWLGVRSVSEERMDSGELIVTAKYPGPLKVSESLDLHPTWRTERGEEHESITVKDVVICESRATEDSSWDELRKDHLGLRDLLILSRWYKETCAIDGAMRYDDPLTTMDGETHGEQYRTVILTGDDEPASRPKGYRPHLIQYSDLGVEGINTWLALRNEFARALDPVVSDRLLAGVAPNTHLAQVGPGVEALGYLLLHLRDGKTPSQASAVNLRLRLDRILDDVGAALPFNGQDWADGFTAAYNGIKHANRAHPETIDVMNCWREAVIVVRAWVACELGIAPDVIKARFQHDPQIAPYVERV